MSESNKVIGGKQPYNANCSAGNNLFYNAVFRRNTELHHAKI